MFNGGRDMVNRVGVGLISMIKGKETLERIFLHLFFVFSFGFHLGVEGAGGGLQK